MNGLDSTWGSAYLQVLFGLLIFAFGLPALAIQVFLPPEYQRFLHRTPSPFRWLWPVTFLGLAGIYFLYLIWCINPRTHVAGTPESPVSWRQLWPANLWLTIVTLVAMLLPTRYSSLFKPRKIIAATKNRILRKLRLRGGAAIRPDIEALGMLASSQGFEDRLDVITVLEEIGVQLLGNPEFQETAFEAWRAALRVALVGPERPAPPDCLVDGLRILEEGIRRLDKLREDLSRCGHELVVKRLESRAKELRDLRRTVAETLMSREPKLAEVAINAVQDDVEALVAIGSLAVMGQNVAAGQSAVFHLLALWKAAQQAESTHQRMWLGPEAYKDVRTYALGLAAGLAGSSATAAGWVERAVFTRLDFPAERDFRDRELATVEQSLAELGEYSAADEVAAWRKRLAESHNQPQPKPARKRLPKARPPVPPPLDSPGPSP